MKQFKNNNDLKEPVDLLYRILFNWEFANNNWTCIEYSKSATSRNERDEMNLAFLLQLFKMLQRTQDASHVFQQELSLKTDYSKVPWCICWHPYLFLYKGCRFQETLRLSATQSHFVCFTLTHQAQRNNIPFGMNRYY